MANKKKADPKVGTGKKPKGSGRRLYTDENPKDIIDHKPTFVKEIGLVDALSPTRQNGLKSMILKIKSFAGQHLD